MPVTRHPTPPPEAAVAAELPRPGESPDGEGARAAAMAALDHDLRGCLTTILGALQTMTRPELAPADPDLAALLSSALTQAHKMCRLLDELTAAYRRPA